jgi:hypothetical protein
MVGAAIADGDWVVVRRQPDADSGDIVAAMLENEGSSDDCNEDSAGCSRGIFGAIVGDEIVPETPSAAPSQ